MRMNANSKMQFGVAVSFQREVKLGSCFPFAVTAHSIYKWDRDLHHLSIPVYFMVR